LRFIGRKENDLFIVEHEDFTHLTKVMRLKAGDDFTGIDFSGREYSCETTKIKKDMCIAKIISERLGQADPKAYITLYQAIPKAAKMETVLQKCTELGISKFVPFISERCVKKPKGEMKTRLQKVADSSICQCGRSDRVEVIDTVDFNGFLDKLAKEENIIFCYEEEEKAIIAQTLKGFRGKKNIGVIIGPEGGFSLTEASAIVECGGISTSLGKRILRTETAGMAVIAMLNLDLL